MPALMSMSEGGDQPARDAVGELSRGEREDRQRQELGKADQAEVEWVRWIA